MTPDLVFYRAPKSKDDAAIISIVHGGQEINIPLTVERLSLLQEDGQMYLGKYVRKHG